MLFLQHIVGAKIKTLTNQIDQFIVRGWSSREQQQHPQLRSAELKCETVGYFQVIAKL